MSLCSRAGENVCRTSGPEGYWYERHKPIHLSVAFFTDFDVHGEQGTLTSALFWPCWERSIFYVFIWITL